MPASIMDAEPWIDRSEATPMLDSSLNFADCVQDEMFVALPKSLEKLIQEDVATASSPPRSAHTSHDATPPSTYGSHPWTAAPPTNGPWSNGVASPDATAAAHPNPSDLAFAPPPRSQSASTSTPPPPLPPNYSSDGNSKRRRRDGSQTYSPSPSSAGIGTPVLHAHPTPPEASSPESVAFPNGASVRQRTTSTGPSTSSQRSSPAGGMGTPPSTSNSTPGPSIYPQPHQHQHQHQPGPQRVTRQPSQHRMRPLPNPETGIVYTQTYPPPHHPYPRPINHQPGRHPRRNTSDPNHGDVVVSNGMPMSPAEVLYAQRRPSIGSVPLVLQAANTARTAVMAGTRRGRGMSVSNASDGGSSAGHSGDSSISPTQLMMMDNNSQQFSPIQGQHPQPQYTQHPPNAAQPPVPYNLQMQQLNLNFVPPPPNNPMSASSSLALWNASHPQQQQQVVGPNGAGSLSGVSPSDVYPPNTNYQPHNAPQVTAAAIMQHHGPNPNPTPYGPHPGSWWSMPGSLPVLVEGQQQHSWSVVNVESPVSGVGSYELGNGQQQEGFNVNVAQALFDVNLSPQQHNSLSPQQQLHHHASPSNASAS